MSFAKVTSAAGGLDWAAGTADVRNAVTNDASVASAKLARIMFSFRVGCVSLNPELS
jgi:hypothetical protein